MFNIQAIANDVAAAVAGKINGMMSLMHKPPFYYVPVKSSNS